VENLETVNDIMWYAMVDRLIQERNNPNLPFKKKEIAAIDKSLENMMSVKGGTDDSAQTDPSNII
jgi:hypothetical protein